MYFMFSRKSNKRILKIILANLLNYRTKDKGKEMVVTPTDENLTGVTLLQLLFQLGVALFQLGVAAASQDYNFSDCSA